MVARLFVQLFERKGRFFADNRYWQGQQRRPRHKSESRLEFFPVSRAEAHRRKGAIPCLLRGRLKTAEPLPSGGGPSGSRPRDPLAAGDQAAFHQDAHVVGEGGWLMWKGAKILQAHISLLDSMSKICSRVSSDSALKTGTYFKYCSSIKILLWSNPSRRPCGRG